MKYSNPAWEPYFEDISPILSKLYFLTNSGTCLLYTSDAADEL